jgi:N-acetylglucosaminyl-diphospho-decaprenol L-rhamnosyltransferase
VGEPARASVLIVSFNTCQFTLEAIGSVVREPSVEVIVVDNASRDHSADAVAARFPAVRLIRSETNLGFAGGVNRAAMFARAAALLVLNSDARLEPGALQRLLDLLDSRPRAGLVSPALYYPDGRPQSSAFRFPGLVQVALDLRPIDRMMESRLNGRIYATRPTPIDHPLGACMLIRRAAWEDVGPLDKGYFMYLEEVDWCRRARDRGWQVWYHPSARAIHHAAASTSQQPEAMFTQLWLARLRYYQRYHGRAYNRLLHLLIHRGLPGGGAETIRGLTK